MKPEAISVIERVEKYKRRYKNAWSVSVQWWAQFEAVYHYCIPNRNLFYWTNVVQGAQKNAKVYDTTGVAACRSFVSKIQNGLTPPQQNWCMLTAGTDIPEDQKEAINQATQKITDIIFNYIRNSNFDLAINECYYDLFVGTAALVINPGVSDDQPFIFYSIPINQLAIEESITGRLESAYRTYGQVKIIDIEKMWQKAKLTPQLQMMVKNDPTAVVANLVEGMICDYDPKTGRHVYNHVVWTDNDPNPLLDEESDSSAWVIFRWSRINTETNGRGPGIDCLPSLISLQRIYYCELATAEFNAARPWLAYDDGIFNPFTFKLEPNSIIPINRSSGDNPPLQPLPPSSDPNFTQMTVLDLRQQINKLAFADPLAPPDQAPSRTATELNIRTKTLAEEIGPIFTRLQQEFLGRLIDRIIYLLSARGLLPELTVNGKTIQLKYQSPLVIAQGQSDVENFMNYVGVLQGIMGESALVALNPVNVPHWLAEKMGIDVDLLAGKKEFKEFLDSQSQQFQEQQMVGMEAQQNGV